MYPSLSNMSNFFRNSVAGSYPIKIKHAFVSNCTCLPFSFSVRESKIPFSPLKSSIVVLYKVFIFFVFCILSIKTVSPFNYSLLQRTVTVLQILDKYNASSKALLPEPTIDTS